MFYDGAQVNQSILKDVTVFYWKANQNYVHFSIYDLHRPDDLFLVLTLTNKSTP